MIANGFLLIKSRIWSAAHSFASIRDIIEYSEKFFVFKLYFNVGQSGQF